MTRANLKSVQVVLVGLVVWGSKSATVPQHLTPPEQVINKKHPFFLLVSISLIFTSFQAGPTTFSSLFGDSSSSLPPPSLGAQLGDQARARARGRAEARARARQPKQLEGNQLDQQVKHTDLHSREKIEKWFAIFLGVTKGGVDQ